MPAAGQFKPLKDRYWGKVNKTDSCWLWEGANTTRYGIISYEGRYVSTHRLAWYLAHGVWPEDGLYVCHACNTPLCVNPAHLVLGTAADNARHMVNCRRSLTGEKNPAAKYTKMVIDEIRKMRRGGIPYHRIALQTGVSKTHVSRICKQQNWKDETT